MESLLWKVRRFRTGRVSNGNGPNRDMYAITVHTSIVEQRNGRLILRYDEQLNTASEIDLIDYH
jgi:hypothetical protein